MALNFKVTNHSLSDADFNLICFFLQMSNQACKRLDDGVVFENIPIEPVRYYSDMGKEAATEEYYRWKIKEVCNQAIIHRGDSNSTSKSYCLEITES